MISFWSKYYLSISSRCTTYPPYTDSCSYEEVLSRSSPHFEPNNAATTPVRNIHPHSCLSPYPQSCSLSWRVVGFGGCPSTSSSQLTGSSFPNGASDIGVAHFRGARPSRNGFDSKCAVRQVVVERLRVWLFIVVLLYGR